MLKISTLLKNIKKYYTKIYRPVLDQLLKILKKMIRQNKPLTSMKVRNGMRNDIITDIDEERRLEIE